MPPTTRHLQKYPRSAEKSLYARWTTSSIPGNLCPSSNWPRMWPAKQLMYCWGGGVWPGSTSPEASRGWGFQERIDDFKVVRRSLLLCWRDLCNSVMTFWLRLQRDPTLRLSLYGLCGRSFHILVVVVNRVFLPVGCDDTVPGADANLAIFLGHCHFLPAPFNIRWTTMTKTSSRFVHVHLLKKCLSSHSLIIVVEDCADLKSYVWALFTL